MGTDPSAAPGLEEEGGWASRSALVLCADRPFLFELDALNPSGARGTPPGQNSL